MSISAKRRVGRYAILRELARGGMAVVYLARQESLERDVALKELAPTLIADEEFVARFVRESRVIAALSHPNIVTVFESFEHNGVPYISMEYVPGGSLRPLIGTLTLAQIGGVLASLLAALAHAEKLGIVHRDLKPENVLVTLDGRVKVVDFGIAKVLDDAGTGGALTATGKLIGTAKYMAPEQALAKPVGPWTDIYAVGVIAYELLVGRVPFEGGDTPLAILMKQVSEPVPQPRVVNPALDPRLERWLFRALAKSPHERFQSAAAAWEQLDETLSAILGPRWHRDAGLPGHSSAAVEETVAAARAPTHRPMPPARSTPAVTHYQSPTRRQDRRRSPLRLLPWAIGLALLAGAGIGAAALLTRSDDGGARHEGSPTVVKTITAQNRTVTVTTSAPPPPPPPTTRADASASGSSLNNTGYSRMQAQDYRGALPLLEQAVTRLAGTGSLDEAYASYNLAYTRFHLGMCEGVLQLLERSEAIQGHRVEIDALRRRAQDGCGHGNGDGNDENG